MNTYQIIKTEYDNRTIYTLNGKIHRDDGPAAEFHNGSKVWFINGKKHREDGPAVERSDGYKTWYINDKELSEKEFNQYILQKNLNLI
jgi:hypothetical protein